MLQEKIRHLLEKWGSLLETEKSIQVLPQEQMQLAVAKGATYYHLVREGKGLQIKKEGALEATMSHCWLMEWNLVHKT